MLSQAALLFQHIAVFQIRLADPNCLQYGFGYAIIVTIPPPTTKQSHSCLLHV